MLTDTAVVRTVRRRRLTPGLLMAILGMLIVATFGAWLIIQGSQSEPPPPAPRPDHPFSVAVPPSELLPEDVIPPVGSANEADVAEDRAAWVSDGSAEEPPVHQGPWTFVGQNRLFIQSLGVDAPIDPVGSDGSNSMVIPTDIKRVGRWIGGAELDDDSGTVLIAGHVNFGNQGPGVLYNLARIEPGAVVVTNDAAGIRSVWRVTALESVDKKALPSDIFTRNGDRTLALVTCGGELLHIDGPNGGYNTYENNVIVRAVPA